MISDRRSNANRKILVKGVGEKPAANAPSVETLPAGPCGIGSKRQTVISTCSATSFQVRHS